MWSAFQDHYLPEERRFRLRSHELHTSTLDGKGRTTITAQVDVESDTVAVVGEGDGPVEAFVHALHTEWGGSFDVVDYTEHAIGRGADARAVAYVESSDESANLMWGIGIDSNITTASLLAVLSAFERQQST